MAASVHMTSGLRDWPSLASAMKTRVLLLTVLLNIFSLSHAETLAFGVKMSLLCHEEGPCNAMLERNNETLICELPSVSASAASRFHMSHSDAELHDSTVCGAVRFRIGTSDAPLVCACDPSGSPRVLCPILHADTTKAGMYFCLAQFLRNASVNQTTDIGPGEITLPVIGTLLQPNATVSTLANRTLLFTASPSAQLQKNRSIANRDLYFHSAVFVRRLNDYDDSINTTSIANDFAAKLAQAVVKYSTDQLLPGNAMLACELQNESCEWQVPESEATSYIVQYQYVYVIATARQLFYVQDAVRVNMTGLNFTVFISPTPEEDNDAIIIWICCCVSAVVAAVIAGGVFVYRWHRQDRLDRKRINVPARSHCTIHTSGDYTVISQTHPNLVSVKDC